MIRIRTREWDHFSVVHGVGAASLLLTDSIGMKRLPVRSCSTRVGAARYQVVIAATILVTAE